MKNIFLSKKTIISIIIFVIIAGLIAYMFSHIEKTEDELLPKNHAPIINTSPISEKTEPKTVTNQISKNTTLTDSFTYSKNDQLFILSESKFNILDKFNINKLIEESIECGTNKDNQYFENILSNYHSDDEGIEYNFEYRGETQDSGVWKVTVIPNKINYNNLENFEEDFAICKAGSDRYPYLISEKWLLFVSSCSTGFDDDSGNPHGCNIVRQAIEDTIILR